MAIIMGSDHGIEQRMVGKSGLICKYWRSCVHSKVWVRADWLDCWTDWTSALEAGAEIEGV